LIGPGTAREGVVPGPSSTLIGSRGHGPCRHAYSLKESRSDVEQDALSGALKRRHCGMLLIVVRVTDDDSFVMLAPCWRRIDLRPGSAGNV
jgi:hypothetical protein